MTKGSSPSPRRSRKSQAPMRRLTRKSVVKMLSAMAEQSPDATRDVTQDFLTTGRAGRRNALPDILGEHALTSTSDLPDKLKGLSTQDDTEPTASSSGTQTSQDSKPSTSNSKPQKTS
ncbi:cAMP-dependent protein kinase inhibitor beta-like [Macrosteles quadrilineatus]|uniref:cAMP-dependent protein kinase inhibitor beta-like n=1 Tax=Macrosteles quadrilineatus TaxID=74068 RepID=UPI0023E227D2|nr:cAMP-dependent protein kinase inhibitor beta-like [Macrosteles quadrilineatus]